MTELIELFSDIDPALAAAPLESGWAPKDHLAHLVDAERQYQRIVELTIAGDGDPLELRSRGATREERLKWFDERNAGVIAAHRADTVEDGLTGLSRVRTTTIELIERLDEEELALPVPGSRWTVGTLIEEIARHQAKHLEELRAPASK